MLPKIQWKRIKWSFHVDVCVCVFSSLFLFGFQFLFLCLIERSTISLLYCHRHTKHNKVNERFSTENLFGIDVCTTTTTKKRVHRLLYQNDIYRKLKIGNKCQRTRIKCTKFPFFHILHISLKPKSKRNGTGLGGGGGEGQY